MDSSINFRTYDSANCSNPSGCSIVFDVNSQFQYIPSNTNNYLVGLQGSIPCLYHDNTLVEVTNPYSNTWSNYTDNWDYFKSVNLTVSPDSYIVWINLKNLTTSDCTFQAAKIQDENIEKTTNNLSFIYIFGENCSYNGETLNSKVSNFKVLGGNAVTHTISAGPSPVTVIIIEKNQ